MLAAYHSLTGGTEVLEFGEVDEPDCGPNGVLIRVRASSLDRLDIYSREASHGVVRKLPHIGGRDIAGDVVEIGSEARRAFPGLEVGMPVVALGNGAHSELAVAPALLVFPMPAELSYEKAAAIPTAGRSAYDALMNRARVRAGEDVLVMAGGSGVGSFGIQIARAAGCRVITTVGSEGKRQPALDLGASDVIDHYREDVGARARELTAGVGVHVVLDHVGAAVWESAFAALRPYGRFVTSGVTAGSRATIHLGQLFTRGLELHGVGRPDDHHLHTVMTGLLSLVKGGLVDPVVHTVLPLREIRRAHEIMEASSFFGKIVLRVDEPAGREGIV